MALETMERLYQAVSEEPHDAAALRQMIVEKKLFGVDIKPEAVRLCELRLWLAIVEVSKLSADEVPPLPNLDRNVMQIPALPNSTTVKKTLAAVNVTTSRPMSAAPTMFT